ncbi:MAG: hypothetical protein NVS2B16_22060 [Chloroflexota bacterium]
MVTDAGQSGTAGSDPEQASVRAFLIADIRGYTRYSQEHGDEAAAQLAVRFADLTTEIVSVQGGKVIELRGDEALAVFTSPRQALRAAIALQTRFAGETVREPHLPLQAGIGLDVGEAIAVMGGYRGGALNLAARLCSLAGPGEVFASETLVALARKVEGFAYVDRGEVHLKGLADPVHVIQVVLEDAVPPTVPKFTIHVTPTSNLPDQATSFIGRERDVAAIVATILRDDVSLLTLTGPGGTGKTRLALQAANKVLGDFADGVFFVALAPVSDPDLVASAVATTLGVREQGNQGLGEALKDHLRSRQMLLVLDNVEHLLEAAPLVGDVLAACPRLKVLATSRTRLHLAAEHGYAVPSLAVPDLKHLPDLSSLTQYDAVALFIQRVRATKADFVITNETAPAVAEICFRLDGLPLAIELAAARVRLFPPQALLRRLSSRLKILTGGARDLPTRQQTLRGAIDWSHSLLNEHEQVLFARLAVFAGGCTLEAAEAVCGGWGALDTDVLDDLESLVEKSLLQQVGEVEPRLNMLETLREYATERLQESGEADQAQRQHAEYYLALAEMAEPEVTGPDQRMWLERLEAEHDNLRAALGQAFARGEIEIGLRLVAAVWPLWYAHGHYREGMRWLEQGLPQSEEVSPHVLARALAGGGTLARVKGDYERAVSMHEESLRLFRSAGEGHDIARALSSLGQVLEKQDNYERATLLFEEALTLRQEMNDTKGTIRSLGFLAWLAVKQGTYDRAVTLAEESLALNKALGDSWTAAVTLHTLGTAHWKQGHIEQGQKILKESLSLSLDLQARVVIAYCLEELAGVAAEQDRTERAARLFGAAEALRTAVGAPLPATEQGLLEPHLSAARDRVDETVWTAARQDGRSMTLEQAVQYALR